MSIQESKSVFLAALASAAVLLASQLPGLAGVYNNSVVTNPNLVGYWTFDESSGNAIQQKPGYSNNSANDLVPVNSATRVSHAGIGSNLLLGNAADFNGIADVFHTAGLDFDGLSPMPRPWGIEFWVQRQGSFGGPKREDYLLNFGNSPAIVYDWDQPNEMELASGGIRTDGVFLSNNNWHHVLIVYYGRPGVGVADRTDFYIDSAGGQVAETFDLFAPAFNLGTMRVGADTASGLQSFQGRMDEVALYRFDSFTTESSLAAYVQALANEHVNIAPEPATGVLLGVGAILLLRRKR